MPSASSTRGATSLIPAAIDGAMDGSLVAFALWTLWYQIGLATQIDLRPSAAPFLLLTALLIILGARRAVVRGRLRASAPADVREQGRLSGRRWSLLAGTVVVLVALVAARERIGVVPVAVAGLLVLGWIAWRRELDRDTLGDDPGEPDAEGSDVGNLAHLVAGLASLGLGVLALLLRKPDADDVFYVNRASWVADHGTAALNDTIFGPNTSTRASGNGLPTPSVETLQGVMAHLLGLQAPTFVYLLFTPIMATAMGWATWRLVRAWAPRRALIAFLVTLVFVLASAESVIGNYSIGRMWQGKVTALAVLVPLVWLYLTRVSVRARRSDVVLLVAAGVTFVGFTTTSSLMAPVIGGVVLVVSALWRRRGLALGALALVAAPLANGVAQVLAPQEIGDGTTHAAPLKAVFAVAFGTSTAMAALAVVATVAAIFFVRHSLVPIVVAAGIAALAAYVPGVVSVADAATGAGPVVWRVAIAAPTAVLVGLLATLPLPSFRVDPARRKLAARAGVACVALAASAAVVIPLGAGRWLWSSEAGGALTSSPQWKVLPEPLSDLRAARRHRVPAGRWLLPLEQMEDLAISTSGPYAVVPRQFYLPSLQTSEQDRRDRMVLLGLVVPGLPDRPSPEAVRAALHRLEVSIACVPGDERVSKHRLGRAVGARLIRIGSMRCHIGRV